MQVKVVVPVWGIDYIETFIKLSLASQLSKSNLPLISKKYKVEYVIYTLKSDKLYLKNSESIKILEKFANVRFETINKLKTRDTYRTYGRIHHKELKKSSKINEYVFLINADFVFSNGFFDQTINEIKKGKRVVNIVCPRANLEPVKTFLLSRFSKSTEIIEIKPKYLTNIYLRNIHKMMNYHIFPKSNDSAFLPSSLMWQAKNGSLYVRNFHFHPVLIYPNSKKIKRITTTIDDGYIIDIFDKNEIYYQKNSNKYYAIELSKKSLFYKPVGAYRDNSKITNYFVMQNKTNFINYNEEVIIGKINKKEMVNFRMQSEKELRRLAVDLIYETNRTKQFRYYVLIKVYWLLASHIAKKKQYVPSFILTKLENIHNTILKDFFRFKKSFN